jgi:hypothetical protein
VRCRVAMTERNRLVRPWTTRRRPFAPPDRTWRATVFGGGARCREMTGIECCGKGAWRFCAEHRMSKSAMQTRTVGRGLRGQLAHQRSPEPRLGRRSRAGLARQANAAGRVRVRSRIEMIERSPRYTNRSADSRQFRTRRGLRPGQHCLPSALKRGPGLGTRGRRICRIAALCGWRAAGRPWTWVGRLLPFFCINPVIWGLST